MNIDQPLKDLGSIDYGENKVVLQRGDNCYLAVVVYGEVDKFLRSKLANIVRDIEAKNTNLTNWNGDASAFVNIKTILKPLIDETRSANREMVDNYLSKKDISLTTDVKKINDKISIFINISNYSSVSAEDCRICPIINSSILALSGINPDLSYSFAENTFYIGSLESYNETQLRLDLKIKGGNPTNIDLELTRTHRGRDITSSTTVSLM